MAARRRMRSVPAQKLADPIIKRACNIAMVLLSGAFSVLAEPSAASAEDIVIITSSESQSSPRIAFTD